MRKDNIKMETSAKKKLQIYQFQIPRDLKWQSKIVNAINFFRLKNKKRGISQRIFTFINKGALQLDFQKFNDILCDMEIDSKIYKNGSGKNVSFFVKNYFSLEDVSPVKNSDLTVNNTHSQSSVSFSPLDTNGTRPSVDVNYLSDDSFWREEILCLRGNLKINKKPSTNYLIFYVTMKSQNSFFLIITLQKKNQKML